MKDYTTLSSRVEEALFTLPTEVERKIGNLLFDGKYKEVVRQCNDFILSGTLLPVQIAELKIVRTLVTYYTEEVIPA